MEYLKIIGMAILQGITEFLPVSSSGHLAIADMVAKLDGIETVTMTVVLHAGTLVSVCIVYRERILALFKPENRRMLWLIFLTLIPTGVIGLAFHFSKLNDRLAESPLALGICFCITAAMLWFFIKPAPENLPEAEEPGTPIEKLSVGKTLLVGSAQGFAILAGVSRSGSTITTALGLGVKRTDAAAFSFIISIPAIFGAVGVKLMKPTLNFIKGAPLEGITWNEVGVLSVGFIVSAAVGYFALTFLLKLLRSGKLRYFGIYCFIVGVTVIVLGLLGILKHESHAAEPSESITATEVPHE